MREQLQYTFFPKHSPPSIELRKQFLSPDNPESPYYGFVGNENAIRKLTRLDCIALGKYNHCCNDLNLAFIGRAGCGKTDLVRRHVKANGLPLVEIYPKAIKDVHDIYLVIKDKLLEHEIELVNNGGKYIIPPINVFIDEVHNLSNKIVQALLKATEQKDRKLMTEEGCLLDCKYIHWIIATTDRGKLFDAFDSRFSKINLSLYTKQEIACIIKNNFKEIPVDICNLISFYCSSVPREALAFTKEVMLEKEINDDSWEEIVNRVRLDNEIDEYGMSYKRLKVLRILADKVVSARKLPAMVGVKTEELENFILPPLLEGVDGCPLVAGTGKGYTITDYGIIELNKRNSIYIDKVEL